MGSNSEAEVHRLLSEWLNASAQKNKFTSAESKAKKDLQAFVEGSNGVANLQEGGNTYEVTFGNTKSESYVIDPKALYDYVVSLGEEGIFWQSVSVTKSKLDNKLSEAELTRLMIPKTSEDWCIRKRKVNNEQRNKF